SRWSPNEHGSAVIRQKLKYHRPKGGGLQASHIKTLVQNTETPLKSAAMDRPSDNLLSRLEQSLRQSRSARMHLAARLRELEAEADSGRAELAEMDNLASQTEAAIYRLSSAVLNSSNLSLGLPSDAELEAAMRQSPGSGRAPIPMERRQQIPVVRSNVEVLSDRFMDRTIPQAVTLLLREEGGPLHVNELYNRLLEGGFRFTGENPTISVAVSLNRNSRFRKVAPGTFDLMIRDASKAS